MELQPSDYFFVKENLKYEYRYVERLPTPFMVADTSTNDVDYDFSIMLPTVPDKTRYLTFAAEDQNFANASPSTAVPIITHHESRPKSDNNSVTYHSMGKFHHLLNLHALPDHRLVVIGSTFGSSRLLLTTAAAKAHMAVIKSSLNFKNELLESAADSIIARLDGAGSYVGVHLRVGDGSFAREAADTVTRIVKALDSLEWCCQIKRVICLLFLNFRCIWRLILRILC